MLMVILPLHTPSLIRSVSKDNMSFQDVLQTGLAKRKSIECIRPNPPKMRNKTHINVHHVISSITSARQLSF